MRNISNNISQSIENLEKTLTISIENLENKEKEFDTYFSQLPENEKILRKVQTGTVNVKNSGFSLPTRDIHKMYVISRKFDKIQCDILKTFS